MAKKEKYRIVSRPFYIDPSHSYYVAQFKFLNLFWMDCDPDRYRPGSPRSERIEHVEEFIDALIHNKRLKNSEKVVKTYV